MNIPHVLHMKDGRDLAVSVPQSICAFGHDSIIRYCGYRVEQVERVVRVS
jgi:hypothetical protein